MRCTDAVLSALLSHPRYRRRKALAEMGEHHVLRPHWA